MTNSHGVREDSHCVWSKLVKHHWPVLTNAGHRLTSKHTERQTDREWTVVSHTALTESEKTKSLCALSSAGQAVTRDNSRSSLDDIWLAAEDWLAVTLPANRHSRVPSDVATSSSTPGMAGSRSCDTRPTNDVSPMSTWYWQRRSMDIACSVPSVSRITCTAHRYYYYYH